MSNLIRVAFALLMFGGGAIANGHSLPYKSWYLGFTAPDYMEVWIESADVVDIYERVYPRAGSGLVSILTPTNNSGDPRGWPKKVALGSGRYVTGADLPKQIYVRWQSLAEPQTYQMVISIPESAREIMRKGEKTFCGADGKWIIGYRQTIGIRLVPGGIAKVWIGGPCMEPVELTTVKAVIDPRGPYQGNSGGRYRPLSAASKAFVEKFGVPYDSWK